MQLVIVESPTKARKLSSYLGAGYRVEASVGHVRDLPKKNLGIDIEHDFEPVYEISDDKKKVVSTLQKLAQDADQIILATDPDREGEAIAWHIQTLLSQKEKGKSPKEKDLQRFVRATFHEITKAAVTDAIAHPITLNMDLVDAQQARRVVDRLVGYKLSPVLWKKIRRGLSAGRVQSVALRLIVEREREIEAFKPEEYWEVDVVLHSKLQIPNSKNTKTSYKVENTKGTVEFQNLPPEMFVARVVEIDGKKYEPKTSNDIEGVVSALDSAHYTIAQVERKERKRANFPPFTTSTLQQAAANKLGFTSKQTMTLAQQLYEEGLITYHRTDSFNLSTQSVQMARDFIAKEFGPRYLPSSPRFFATKSKNAQEAHEAIRCTDVLLADVVGKGPKLTSSHQRLYDLIRRRFLACQMESAIYDQTTITVRSKFQVPSSPHTHATLRASGSILKFDGWMKLFPGGEDAQLPDVKEGDTAGYVEHHAAQKFTQPPARYNDASLVKTLELKGIGRPSTYASIISVIVDRGYVERKDKRFFATSVGMTVSDFLLKYFSQIMDYDFTAEMEEDLDRIARGEKQWRAVVKTFYTPLDKKIASVTDDADRVAIPVEETGETCPTCGATDGGKIVIRTGRFGKFKSCNRFPDCKFTQNIVEIVEGVKCPLCQQGDVVAKNSRWGKAFYGCGRYPDCDWASWSKPAPGSVVTPEQWKVMQAERKERAEKRKAAWAEKNGASVGQGDGTTGGRGNGKTGKQASSKTGKKKTPTKKKAGARKK